MNHFVIHEGFADYCAWPSIARAGNGDILVSFTRTKQHIAPNGQAVVARSTDNGATWLEPELIRDTPLDDRPLGLTSLADGRVVASVWSKRPEVVRRELMAYARWTEPGMLARWLAHVDSPAVKASEALAGFWTLTSDENGRNWSGLAPGRDLSHGAAAFPDGSLLAASFVDAGGKTIALFKTRRIGQPWKHVATVAMPESERPRQNFSEPHILRLNSGRLLLMTRTDAIPYDGASPRCVLWASVSDDGGAAWAEPFPTPLWGYPPHLTSLSDGRVLCTYGYRRPPFGQRACVSRDGLDWDLSREIVIRDDAPNDDLGYPVSIELSPGRVLTVYYQINKRRVADTPHCYSIPDGEKPAIMGTIWELNSGF
ncbi:MAG: exo-alpha-sialidase [Lentisphaerae bacterium]|nr:exo-alpha-sialidase [Lentisphaerota bacterium]